jgi:hypothetical protein
MFYIQVVHKSWDRRESPANQASSTSKQSEVEARNEKSSKLAKAKFSARIRNTQQLYYLDRRLFC